MTTETRKELLKWLGCFFVVFILVCIFSLSFREWCWYNLVYKPLYFIFSGFFYCAYIVDILFGFFILLFLIGVIWMYCRDFIDKDETLYKKILSGSGIIVIVAFIYLMGKPYLADAEHVINGRYYTEKSDLSRMSREIHRGGRSSRSYIYRIYSYELKGDYGKREIKGLGAKSCRDFELNVYQYKDLQNKIKEYATQTDSIGKIKVTFYYLPNTNQVLGYELSN